MKTMLMHALDGHQALVLSDAEDPTPGPNEVLIEVGAMGCNFADTLICKGGYQIKPSLPFAPGSEVAGVIAGLGEEVTGLSVGQRVYATLPYGGYATMVVAKVSDVFPVPDTMPFVDAAAFGVAYLTSHLALVDRAALQPSETVLIHAAAGGVGMAALQIAVALGARVIASAGDAEKRALCREQGAHETIDYRDEDWPEQVKALTQGQGADVIYDPVGGDVFDRSMKCVAFDGRVLVIGFASGRIPEVRLNRVMLKNISVVGVHIHAYRERAPERMDAAMAALLELYQSGKLKPLISAQYDMVDAARALNALASRKTTGKVVLLP